MACTLCKCLLALVVEQPELAGFVTMHGAKQDPNVLFTCIHTLGDEVRLLLLMVAADRAGRHPVEEPDDNLCEGTKNKVIDMSTCKASNCMKPQRVLVRILSVWTN